MPLHCTIHLYPKERMSNQEREEMEIRKSQMKRERKGEERQIEKLNKIVLLLNVVRRVTHYM